MATLQGNYYCDQPESWTDFQKWSSVVSTLQNKDKSLLGKAACRGLEDVTRGKYKASKEDAENLSAAIQTVYSHTRGTGTNGQSWKHSRWEDLDKAWMTCLSRATESSAKKRVVSSIQKYLPKGYSLTQSFVNSAMDTFNELSVHSGPLVNLHEDEWGAYVIPFGSRDVSLQWADPLQSKARKYDRAKWSAKASFFDSDGDVFAESEKEVDEAEKKVRETVATLVALDEGLQRDAHSSKDSKQPKLQKAVSEAATEAISYRKRIECQKNIEEKVLLLGKAFDTFATASSALRELRVPDSRSASSDKAIKFSS